MAAPTTATTGGRRKFAPVPIETTYERVRKVIGPAPELTPDPSPRSASPQLLPLPRQDAEKRRFAPQLVESSRRSRRAGDIGPATKYTDKTDITPGTNHIYAVRRGRRHNKVQSQARRESCDDEVAEHVFDLIARDLENRLEEVALSAFPNTHARTGGAEHFVLRDASDDDSSTDGRRLQGLPSGKRKSRRDSSADGDVNWAFREMQEHHEQLVKMRGEGDRLSSLDLDRMSMDSPPENPLWTTSRRSSSSDSLRPIPIGEAPMPFIPKEPLATIGETAAVSYTEPDSPVFEPIGETFMPYIPSAPPGRAADMPYVPVSSAQIPPETGFRSRGIFASAPFGGYRGRDLAADRDAHRLKSKSPPMLGDDLEFRKCSSPKMTKLEPEHPWMMDGGLDEGHRDKTGQFGLWQGFCYSPEKTEAVVPLVDRPTMIATPHEPRSPCDPHDGQFCTEPGWLSEMSLASSQSSISDMHSAPASTSEHRARHGEPKGLHMLVGLDERLRKEKAAADLNEKIAAEFDDSFVTQVYNYLSLGYPAMARAYDDELAKISRISAEELERDDDVIMDGIGKARGFISISADDMDERERCPRWRALKLYIFEWARQHPDLGSISSLAWGVRERRGNWGI